MAGLDVADGKWRHATRQYWPPITKWGPCIPCSQMDSLWQNCLMLWLHRRFVLQLGTEKIIQIAFEKLTCIAGNCVDVLWADIDWNRPWHTILHAWHIDLLEYHSFKMWPINICMFFLCKLRCLTWWQSLGETFLALEPRRWKAWTLIFPMANPNQKIPTAGITGLTLPERPIHRSNATPTSYLLLVMMLFFFPQAFLLR